MTTVRTEAEALARALEIGAVGVSDVVAWADAIIEMSDHPPASICEVAMAARKYPPDVAALLRDIEGDVDDDAARQRVLQRIDEGLRQDAGRADQLAHALFQLATADEIEDDELKNIASWAWDALDLADARTIAETRDEIVDQMRRALRRAVHTSSG